MTYEQKDNSGAIFKNDKGDNSRRPDYTGNAMINGQPMKISAWVKDGKRGKFLSLSFSEPKPVEKPVEAAQDFDDNIPF